MDGRSVTIALADKRNSATYERSRNESVSARDKATNAPRFNRSHPFLRIPPFPGARTSAFVSTVGGAAEPNFIDLIRCLKVGGPYWSAQPELPSGYALVRDAAFLPFVQNVSDSVVLWTDAPASKAGHASIAVVGDCDPWHMLAGAKMLVTSAADEIAVVALIVGVPVRIVDPMTRTIRRFVADPGELLMKEMSRIYENPFTGNSIKAIDAVRLCGFWRQLIDGNRDIAGGLGFAFWKHDYVAPLLWSGQGNVRFLRSARDTQPGRAIAVWQSKTPRYELLALEERKIPLIEVEDGFLRSQGLGADCVPPLSITVDRRGAYFDPSQPSELEILLQEGKFDEELRARASRLRRAIVEAGLGKYERASVMPVERPGGGRRHILVPGQVEDDRAVQTGGCGLVTNLGLLEKVRARAPDAYILYKPHPDVIAGHRRGAMPNGLCLQYADEIVSDRSISPLIEMVDEVHVNTSLAGFEALLRGKRVTTYGVPFYSGWGLTTDLGPVPKRRTARLALDELVAATLLVYPRYLDPVTGLPCPAEVVVERLTRGMNSSTGPLVFMRRLQGRLMRRLRSAVG